MCIRDSLVGVAGGLQDHAAAAVLELAEVVAVGVEHPGDAGVREAYGCLLYTSTFYMFIV